MSNLKVGTIIEQLEAIRRELTDATRVAGVDSSDGAGWLRNRMLKRAAGQLQRAINELECYRRPDGDLDAFGRNLRTLEEHSD